MLTMIHLALLAAVAALAPRAGAVASPTRADRLQVVATIPDLADLARAIGGDRVEVISIARGRENIHAVRLKPSHVVATSRADVFVQVGLSLEHAWVPGLLRTARNRDVEPGGKGFVNASEGWEAIDVPETASRRQGADVHLEGNPHVNLAPAGGRHMAGRILAGLSRADPEGRETYEKNHAALVERLEAAEARWAAIGRELRGRKVVEYHKEFDYLFRAHGLELAGTVEPKPGVPPSPGHLARLIGTMREEGVSVVVTAAWSNDKHVAEVARKTGAKLVELPSMVDANAAATSWIAMMDDVHRRLAAAFGIDPAGG